MKNIITKAVGAKENLDVSVQEHDLEDNDLYLLCSDGLHGMISDRTLKRYSLPRTDPSRSSSAS